jgi:hypothetical protein
MESSFPFLISNWRLREDFRKSVENACLGIALIVRFVSSAKPGITGFPTRDQCSLTAGRAGVIGFVQGAAFH